MTTTQKWTLGCLALAVIVLFGGGALAFLLLVPSVEEQIPPGASTFVVTLSTPLNDAQVPLNQFTTVTAEALGVKPITALELWIDGTPSETKNAPAGSTLNQFATSWTWTPASEGEHTLFARALDASKSVGMSNVVRVTASKDANVVPSAGYQTQPGDTAASIAQKANTSPQQILDLNPQVNPSGTITSGQTITVPIPTPPPTPPPPATPEPPPSPTPDPGASDPPGNSNQYVISIVSLWGQLFGVDPPMTPGLTVGAGAGKCSIDLYIDDKSNNESGFYIYRLDNSSFNFKWIATLDAHSGTKPIHYVDPVGTGKHQYFVSSFNSAGKSDSKIVKTAIIEPCGAPPGLGLSKGTVTVKQPVDKIYCYLSVDNGPWKRIPPSVNTFITPTKPGEFDVSQYLKILTPAPPPPKITLHLECWGWLGSTLIYLGEATETIIPGGVKLIAQQFIFAGFLAQNANGNFTDPSIARPTNAKTTVDVQECYNHASSDPFPQLFKMACAVGANNGYQFLTWDWSPNGCTSGTCVKDIDGYNVYLQYPASVPKLINTISSPKQKIAIVPPEYSPNLLIQPSFLVRAFKGTYESDDSNLALTKQTQAKMLVPAQVTNWRGINQDAPSAECLFAPMPLNLPVPAQGQTIVGFWHWYDPGAACKVHNRYFRGATRFDLSQIKGKVVDARLQLRWQQGLYHPPIVPELHPSCATTLMLGTEEWWNKDYGSQPVQIPGVAYMDLGWTVVGPGKEMLEYDVTSAVKQWMLGSTPNYGFVFRGSDETLPNYNNACYSLYSDLALIVTYQPTGQ